MPSEARAQAALAAVERLQAQALLRAVLRSPAASAGAAAVAVFTAMGLYQSLDRLALSPVQVGLGAAGIAAGAGFSAARVRAGERDGPLGFALVDPRFRLMTGLRRAAMTAGVLLVLWAAALIAARPADAAVWSLAALVGAIVGVVAGVGGAVWLPVFERPRPSGLRLPAGVVEAAPAVLLWLALVIGAARSHAQDAAGAAQLFATLAIAATVLPALRINPRALNLAALTPQPMTRLILPLSARPAGVALAAALPAGLAAGLSPAFSLGLALSLAVIAGAARIFLGLAALGRSDRAANMAGGVELAIVGIMPTTGPAAIGPLALLWIAGRFVWLWRRGRRVRWLDPEAAS